MTSVTFRMFKAIDEPESCTKFIEGHRKVLEIFGITMITSNKALWVNHPNTYVIIVESAEDGRALGGARVQIADALLPLPIEDAVGVVDKNIFEVVGGYKNIAPTAEICGLWNSREIAGFGIGSFFLTRASIALAILLNIKTLFALAAPATVKVAARAGFMIEKSLGKDGFFNYPKLDLIATAMLIKDVHDLSDATAENIEFVKELVANPVQTRLEKGVKGEIMVDYILKPNFQA